MLQKIYSKMNPVLCTNTHRDVIDLVTHGMVNKIKPWISGKQNITFLPNAKILYLCLCGNVKTNKTFTSNTGIVSPQISAGLKQTPPSDKHHTIDNQIRRSYALHLASPSNKLFSSVAFRVETLVKSLTII